MFACKCVEYIYIIGFRTQPVDQTTHIHCDENVGMEATDVSATVLPLRNCGIPEFELVEGQRR